MAKKRTRSTSAAPRTIAPRITEMEAAPAKSLSTEYHYVIRDLTQIAVIAAVLVAGLIVLSFFI
jgi:hypothetical protein